MLSRSCLILCCALTALPSLAAPLKISAYINVKSGCQRPTEAILAKLAKTYGDKVALEIVDFGTPDGAKAWRESGMRCMGIRLDGKDETDIVFQGAKIRVAFMKPAGFFWLLEELETAVRQKIEGVADTDRLPPTVTTTAADGKTTLVIGGKATYSGSETKRIQSAAETLSKLAKEKPLTQEDFWIVPEGKKAVLLTVRKQGLLSAPVPVDATDARNRIAIQKAAAPLTDVINAYPCLRRPFRWQVPPQTRAPRK